MKEISAMGAQHKGSPTTMDARKFIYYNFVREHREPPTIIELAEEWGVTINTARCYLSTHMRDAGINIRRRGASCEKKSMLIRRFCEIIYEDHGIYPTRKEIEMAFGFTRQRMEQYVRRWEKGGLSIPIRGNANIRWDGSFVERAISQDDAS